MYSLNKAPLTISLENTQFIEIDKETAAKIQRRLLRYKKTQGKEKIHRITQINDEIFPVSYRLSHVISLEFKNLSQFKVMTAIG